MNEHAAPAPPPATYQDVLDAPPNMVAEIAHGALYLQPRPASRHAFAESALGGELVGPYQQGRGGPGGWWIVFEPELHLGQNVLVPDFAGWRRERMPVFPDAPAFDLAPDWVCEILSPGTRRFDLTVKRELYGVAGVGHLWMIDPIARTLEAFARQGDAWMLIAAIADAAEVRVAPFDAAAFALDALWPPAP